MNWKTFAVGVALQFSMLAGCYTYAPVATPAPGAHVRASLTVEGAVRQSEVLGRPERTLTGRIVSLDDQALALDVITASTRGQLREIVLRDTLVIAVDQVTAIEERRLSWARTGVVFAGFVVGGFLLVNNLTAGGEVDSGTEGPTVPLDRITIPIFQIRR